MMVRLIGYVPVWLAKRIGAQKDPEGRAIIGDPGAGCGTAMRKTENWCIFDNNFKASDVYSAENLTFSELF